MGSAAQQDLLRRASTSALTYPEAGVTALPELPAGYRHLERTRVLGSGPEAYERACAGLLSWRMHRQAGLRPVATAPTAIAGACVVLLIGRRPLAILAPCRVVYAVADVDRQGFAYGTLPGHPETGEEAFVVSYRQDERVALTVRAFSRPATLLARAGGPVSRLAQDVMIGHYFRTLRAIAQRQ